MPSSRIPDRKAEDGVEFGGYDMSWLDGYGSVAESVLVTRMQDIDRVYFSWVNRVGGQEEIHGQDQRK